MIKIPTAELSSFLSKAKEIQSNSFIPVLKYLKLECDGDVARIYKTNLKSFLVFQIDGAKFSKNFSLLLDEKILRAAMSECSSDTMKISYKDQKSDSAQSGVVKIVSIEDGQFIDVKFQSDDERTFPLIPEGDKNTLTVLNQDMIDSIYLASKCCNPPKEVTTWHNYVHVKKIGKKDSYVCGMNGAIMYFKTYKKELPDISLDLQSCNVIKQYDQLNYYSGGGYNFFDAGKTVFGFVKSEVTIPDFSYVVQKMDKSKYFSINRKDVIRFCKLAIGVNPMSIIEPCSITSDDNNSVTMDYENIGSAVSSKMVLEVKKNKKYTVQKFLFNPKELLAVLDTLSFEKINLVGPCEGNYYILSDEDKDYVGAIRQIVFQNEAKTQKDAKENSK